MNNSLELSLLVAGLAVVSILIDSVFRGKLRTNYAAGVIVIACALAAIVMLLSGATAPVHSKAHQVILLGLLAVGAIGVVMRDNANIEDQEQGRMSRFGSWWNGFEDNYENNIIDKWETYAIMGVLMFLMFSAMFKPERQESNTTAMAKTSPAIVQAPEQKRREDSFRSQKHKATPNTSKAHKPVTTKHALKTVKSGSH